MGKNDGVDSLFSGLKGLIKVKLVVTEGFVFRLHTHITFLFLVVCSILITGNSFIGDPIDCIQQDKQFPGDLLDTYCWIHTTFSVPEAWNKTVGDEVAYPGVEKHTSKTEKTYHSYYQWVSFVLFFQAILFYAPHYYWKSSSGKRMKDILLDLDKPLMEEDKRQEKMKLLVEYLKTNLGNHQWFAIKYYICEVYLLVNIIFQMYVMDWFFGGQFLSYGLEVMTFSEWEPQLRYDPMIKVFPRITKCNFHYYGPSGDVQMYDTMCVLPINIINEKIYIFLWFWFYFLQIVTAVTLIYRLICLIFPVIRQTIFRYRANRCRAEHIYNIQKITQFGDNFVLTLLHKNMDPINFMETMALFSTALKYDDQDMDAVAEKLKMI